MALPLLGISVILVKILGAVFKIPLAGILHETEWAILPLHIRSIPQCMRWQSAAFAQQLRV